jgi:hypothetical protein
MESGAGIDAIETRAERVLAEVPAYVWDGESLPVPVEEIVSTCFGLRVCDADDLASVPGAPPIEEGQALSGLLLASRGEIWVNAEEAREWPPRRRFTVGHELGHWVLHRTGQQALFCRHGTVGPPEEKPASTRPPLPVSEAEANAFAAALLMPARLIEHHYNNTTRDFEELCELFSSSGAAMSRRLRAVV